MVVRILAPAAAAVLVLSAAAGPTGTVAQQAFSQEAVLASDSSFIEMAGSLGLLQEKLGTLAAEKGSSPAVRDFGKRMAADYAQANERLAAGAKAAAYPAPVMIRQHKQVLERFLRTGGSSFDKKYMTEMVREHTDAVQLFQAEAKGGTVASLKALAQGMLPSVEEHRGLAMQTAGAVGADVTATNTAERAGS